MAIPTNLSNTYYAQANQTVQGSQYPSMDIVGAGGDTIYLGGNNNKNTYIPGLGHDTLIGDGSQNSQIAFFYATQPVVINLLTGIVSNNGNGGTDSEPGIETVHTGNTNTTIIGDDKNDTFWINGGNNNVTGGAGLNQANYHGQSASNFAFTVNSDNSISVHNNLSNTTDIFKNVQIFGFDGSSTTYDYRNIKNPISYQLQNVSNYTFAGGLLQFKLLTSGLPVGTNLNYTIFDNQQPKSISGSVIVDQSGLSNISAST